MTPVVDITREPDVGVTRSWIVNTAAATYRATWCPEHKGLPMQWKVFVFVQRASNGRPQHWRTIRGRWIIDEVRRFENERTEQ